MLFPIGTTPWVFTDQFDLMVDFCFWLLDADGLHVAPFDHHTGGDGTLRAAGMDAESWRTWVHEIISTYGQRKYNWHHTSVRQVKDTWKSLEVEALSPEEHSQKFRQTFHQQQLMNLAERMTDFAAKPFCPVDFWHGRPEVEEQLNKLWERYTSSANQRDLKARKSREEELHGDWTILGAPDDPYAPRQRNIPAGEVQITDLRRALAPYHTRLNGFIIYYVEYPRQIDYLIPPLSVVMTLVDGKLDYKDIIPRAVQAAEALATYATQ